MDASALTRIDPRRRALLVGIGSWFVGVLVTYVMMVAAGGEVAAFVASAPVLFTSFAYSTMHLWPIVLGSDQALLYLGLSPVPGFILGIGGYVLAALDHCPTTRASIVSGSMIAIGYLVMVVGSVGYMLLRGRGGFVGTVLIEIRPTVLVLIVLFGGVLFPLGFGGLGGYVYARRDGTAE